MENIVVFDLETTGLDKTKDQIIQFAAIKLNKSTNKLVSELNLYIQPTGNYTIGIASYMKHHITPDFLSDKPYFSQVASSIVEFIKDCDILTYNGSSFDIPFLKNSLIAAGYGDAIDFTKVNCYDSFLEEKRRNGNTLGETYARYAGKTMDEAGLTAHDALSDVKATYSIFVAQSRKEEVKPEEMFGEDNVIKTMDFNGSNVPCFNIGKYRGVSLEYVKKYDTNYLNWTLSDKCNFMESTKNYIRKFIND